MSHLISRLSRRLLVLLMRRGSSSSSSSRRSDSSTATMRLACLSSVRLIQPYFIVRLFPGAAGRQQRAPRRSIGRKLNDENISTTAGEADLPHFRAAFFPSPSRPGRCDERCNSAESIQPVRLVRTNPSPTECSKPTLSNDSRQ